MASDIASAEKPTLTWHQLRAAVERLSEKMNEWAGIPLPVEGCPLVIDSRFPNAAALMEIGRKADAGDTDNRGRTLINTFWSWSKRSDIVIFRERDGRTDWGVVPGVHHIGYDLGCLEAADVWGIEPEARALELLGTLLLERQFHQYLLTGQFMERSARSGVSYLFRRLKPTVAIREDKGRLRILCCLCLHPIAYYAGSWAGAMVPTDDVIAHLMLMRGDEKMFWRRANQQPPYRPEAGL